MQSPTWDAQIDPAMYAHMHEHMYAHMAQLACSLHAPLRALCALFVCFIFAPSLPRMCISEGFAACDNACDDLNKTRYGLAMPFACATDCATGRAIYCTMHVQFHPGFIPGCNSLSVYFFLTLVTQSIVAISSHTFPCDARHDCLVHPEVAWHKDTDER